MPGNRRKSSTAAQIQIVEEIGLIEEIGFCPEIERFRQINRNHKKKKPGELHTAHRT